MGSRMLGTCSRRSGISRRWCVTLPAPRQPVDHRAAADDTQVWKSTTHVGCVTHDCAAKWPDMRYFTVCNYSPAGNIMGEFAENVLRPGRRDARMMPAYPDPIPVGQ